MRFFFVHIATVSYKLRFIRLASFDILDEDERDPRFMHLLKANFFCFWKRQKEEILCSDIKRKHELPISGIRGAIKSNDQVKDEDERDPRLMDLLKANLFCFWKQQKEEILCSGAFWRLVHGYLQITCMNHSLMI
ncbi:uncharacterized protein LOC132046674 isoform X2 [Lycium ferocissimum]|uniref:uncharacterized protein LOC132046674 isoform X2 n=1 Tax=Lycium ferocissimum TaxID=112874 RepID=UPI002816894E|nr:uncharacterized protein LOC132046674 isoform X2 [Lycium ferocissimum]